MNLLLVTISPAVVSKIDSCAFVVWTKSIINKIVTIVLIFIYIYRILHRLFYHLHHKEYEILCIILLFFVLFTGARCFCRHIFFKDFFGFVYWKLFTSPLIISSFPEYSVKIIYIFHILMVQSWFCVSTNPFLFIVFWKSYSCFCIWF